MVPSRSVATMRMRPLSQGHEALRRCSPDPGRPGAAGRPTTPSGARPLSRSLVATGTATEGTTVAPGSRATARVSSTSSCADDRSEPAHRDVGARPHADVGAVHVPVRRRRRRAGRSRATSGRPSAAGSSSPTRSTVPSTRSTPSSASCSWCSSQSAGTRESASVQAIQMSAWRCAAQAAEGRAHTRGAGRADDAGVALDGHHRRARGDDVRRAVNAAVERRRPP